MEKVYAGRLIPREVAEKYSGYRLPNEEEQSRYDKFVDTFKSDKAIQILKEHSTTFKILGMNQIGIRTATLPELDEIARSNPGFLIGHYEDSREVVLRSNGSSYGRNDQIAKSLAEIIGEKSFNTPFIIKGLEIAEDANSEYGLTLVPGEQFEYFKAPDFSHENNGRNFLKINDDYSIEWCKEGEQGRNFRSKKDGLSRLCLFGDLDLDSSLEVLDYFYSDDKVVLVDAVGITPKV